MSELRQNIITRDWVVIASERARRPHAFAVQHPGVVPPLEHDPTCPFCPGQETETGEEVFHIGEPWQVRVVSNKYPALTRAGLPNRRLDGIHRSMNAIGYHEVIVETARHDLQPSRMHVLDLARVLGVWRRRYGELRQDPRMEAVVVFRNHGTGAGSSQPHPHSQIIATPVVPAQMRSRMEIAVRYFDETGECVFCRTIRDERATGERLITVTRHFCAFIPYAALGPFHLWVFPLRHMSSFDQCSDDEIADLAVCLRTVLVKLDHGLNDPDYNLLVRSIPTRVVATDYFHWYLSVVPRIAISAGFELGSGMFINTSIPEECAEFLRGIGATEPGTSASVA